MHITSAAAPNRFVRVRHTSSRLSVRDGAVFYGLDEAIHGLGIHTLRWNGRKGLLFVDDHWWPGLPHQIRFFDECGLEISARRVNDRLVALKEESLDMLCRQLVRAHRRYDRGSFRNGPVPGTGRRGRWGHSLRIVSTSGERRHVEALDHDEDCRDLGIRARAKRRGYNLPDTRDDVVRSDYHDCGWKSHRRTQWRAGR